MKLRPLLPQIEQDEAVKMFKSRMKRMRLGKFLFETGFFIPYFLFRVEVRNAGKIATELLAIDATDGALDLYKFDAVPDDLTDCAEAETTQISATRLTEKEALAILQTTLRRRVYLTNGFFKIDDFSITGTFLKKIYIPYWVGLYEKNKRAEIEIIDAVRGKFEGGKIQALVLDWFQSEATRRTQTKTS